MPNDTPSSPGRAGAWALAALVVLLAGYTALVRGSTTLAPALLAFGYVVAVPAAILRTRRGGARR